MPRPSAARPRIAIAHDYLTQRGGAERVVLTLHRAFPEATIHTTLYDPDGTYPEFRDAHIVTSPLNRVEALRHDHRKALPFLASASSRLRVDADLTIVSSSGWAHGFDITGKSVVYCYSPPRWLHDSEQYLGSKPTRSAQGMALLALRPGLKRWDRRAATRHDRYLAISRVIQERIRRTYGIEADILPAPHSMDAEAPLEPIEELSHWPEGYALVVSRLLPYKNVDVAIDAVRASGRPLVVIGRGPDEARLRATLPDNARMLSGLTDAQMRWAYSRAGVLIAGSHEDFGLTPLEAAAFGVPTVALRAGGFLDTVLEGETGVFFDQPTPRDVAAALDTAYARDWDREALRNRAADFSEERFISGLTKVTTQVLAGRQE